MDLEKLRHFEKVWGVTGQQATQSAQGGGPRLSALCAKKTEKKWADLVSRDKAFLLLICLAYVVRESDLQQAWQVAEGLLPGLMNEMKLANEHSRGFRKDLEAFFKRDCEKGGVLDRFKFLLAKAILISGAPSPEEYEEAARQTSSFAILGMIAKGVIRGEAKLIIGSSPKGHAFDFLCSYKNYNDNPYAEGVARDFFNVRMFRHSSDVALFLKQIQTEDAALFLERIQTGEAQSKGRMRDVFTDDFLKGLVQGLAQLSRGGWNTKNLHWYIAHLPSSFGLFNPANGDWEERQEAVRDGFGARNPHQPFFYDLFYLNKFEIYQPRVKEILQEAILKSSSLPPILCAYLLAGAVRNLDLDFTQKMDILFSYLDAVKQDKQKEEFSFGFLHLFFNALFRNEDTRAEFIRRTRERLELQGTQERYGAFLKVLKEYSSQAAEQPLLGVALE